MFRRVVLAAIAVVAVVGLSGCTGAVTLRGGGGVVIIPPPTGGTPCTGVCVHPGHNPNP